MKTAMVRATFFLGVVVLSLSCAKKDEGAQSPTKAAIQQAKYSDILKNWTSEACVASKLIPVSDTHYKIEYDLHGDSFVKRYNYYTDAECKTQVAQITYAGRLDIADSTNEDQYNSKHVDLKFTQATVTAVNEEGQKFLQLVDLCGQKEFPAGEEVDLTEASQQALCILQTSNGVTYFDRATVVDGALLTATGFGEKPTNKNPDARPNIDTANTERFIKR